MVHAARRHRPIPAHAAVAVPLVDLLEAVYQIPASCLRPCGSGYCCYFFRRRQWCPGDAVSSSGGYGVKSLGFSVSAPM